MEPLVPRLTAHVWVTAQVRLCDVHFIPLVVARRGDAEAGAILVRLVREPGSNLLLARHTQIDGSSAWMIVGGDGGEAVDDTVADAYIARQVDRDPDLWVLDITDPQACYWPDQPIQG
jgi:hypothetical protein